MVDTTLDPKLNINRPPSSILHHLFLCVLCAFAPLRSNAQRGTGSNPVATTEQTTVSIFALPQAAVAPYRQKLLTWDNVPGASNRVAFGPARGAWTNGSVIVTTNNFPLTNGVHYAITALVDTVESLPALWPSNRVGELWLVGMSNDLKQRTNIVRLTAEFDETPPGNMQLWGIENRTVMWK